MTVFQVFLSVCPQGLYIIFCFYRRGDEYYAEDDEKRDLKWVQNAYKTIIMPSLMPIDEHLQK